ncbi:MAG: ribose-5-phosphate isomerase RpiA [Spirochaetales bacterium]|nr:ribose-5-phosphate isomerase RpiA [Spirochaetales bacterium]
MPKNECTLAEQKILAARHAVDDLIRRGELRSNMKLGLGTGSTAMPAVARIAEHIREGNLTGIRAVATSFQTTIACEDLGIPVFSLNSKEISGELDLAIDGADEISPAKHLIKGGGAALLLEKIVAYNSALFVIVADSSKRVTTLGTRFALPVEVISEARVSVTRALASLGAQALLREGVRKAGPVVTDNGNLILDCVWKEAVDAYQMEEAINQIVGVVENGFFTRTSPIVYAAANTGIVERV